MRDHAKSIVALIGPPDKQSKKKLMSEDDGDDEEYEDDLESMHSDYREALDSGDNALATSIFRQMVEACGGE